MLVLQTLSWWFLTVRSVCRTISHGNYQTDLQHCMVWWGKLRQTDQIINKSCEIFTSLINHVYLAGHQRWVKVNLRGLTANWWWCNTFLVNVRLKSEFNLWLVLTDQRQLSFWPCSMYSVYIVGDGDIFCQQWTSATVAWWQTGVCQFLVFADSFQRLPDNSWVRCETPDWKQGLLLLQSTLS